MLSSQLKVSVVYTNTVNEHRHIKSLEELKLELKFFFSKKLGVKFVFRKYVKTSVFGKNFKI